MIAAVGLGATHADHLAGDNDQMDHLEYIEREQRDAKAQLELSDIVATRKHMRGSPRLSCEARARMFRQATTPL